MTKLIRYLGQVKDSHALEDTSVPILLRKPRKLDAGKLKINYHLQQGAAILLVIWFIFTPSLYLSYKPRECIMYLAPIY